MKRSCSELKAQARESLLGKYSIIIAASIIISLITSFLLLPFEMQIDEDTAVKSLDMLIYLIAYLIVTLISIIFMTGLYKMHLKIARNENVYTSDVFTIFKSNPHRYVGMNLLTGILIGIPIYLMLILAFLIFGLYPEDTIPLPLTGINAILWIIGIVLSIRLSLQYMLCTFIMLDNPDMRITDILRQSRHYMKGNLLRYLYLCISFIGYFLLVILSLGLASLWVTPYLYQTQVQFYLDIVDDNTVDVVVDDGFEFESE